MRSIPLILAAVLALTGAAEARDPITGAIHSFFGGYRHAPPPVGGDCAAVAAAIGPEATWFGSFSGSILIETEQYQHYGTQACFESEPACRLWQQQAMTYAQGPVAATSCRPGLRGNY